MIKRLLERWFAPQALREQERREFWAGVHETYEEWQKAGMFDRTPEQGR